MNSTISRPITSIVLIASLYILFIASFPLFAGMPTTATETYVLRPDGSVAVTVIYYGTSSGNYLKVPLEKGFEPDTLYAFTPDGTPLFVNVTDGAALIEVLNISNEVLLTYDALVGNSTNPLMIKAVIHPFTKAVVYLPRNAALMDASGSPDISVSNGTIVIKYNAPGTYEVIYSVIPSYTSTRTSTTPQTMTTTQNQLPTPSATGTSTSGLPTTAGVGTSPKTSTKSTEGGSPLINESLIYFIVGVLAALASVVALLWVRKRGKSEKIEPSITSGLDDRDIKILSTLKSGSMSVSELARALNLNKSVVWRRVRRLKEIGLLDMRVEKGKTIYSLTSKGISVLNSLEGRLG